MTDFSNLGLIEPLLRAVSQEGYDQPTPIQGQTIPLLLQGRDLLGCAQTGTGKTAAFALPILQHIHSRPLSGRRRIRVLVLSPTRELAAQIDERFGAYGRHLPLRHTVIFGGVSQKRQEVVLRRGVDILTATPGRLIDLVGQGIVDLGKVEIFVLDEADRMLDMGFIPDIRRILGKLPPNRQNLLFSATMPHSIETLGASFLRDPAWVDISPQTKTVDQISQSVLYVRQADKRRLVTDLLRRPETERALVFTRTKHGANRLVRQLDRAGIVAAAIHGNKSQSARRAALESFRSGRTEVLVATDLAARGIDVADISHVINFDLPNEPETYIHRIGRTGRAGRSGVALSFCDETEGSYLLEIENLIGFSIRVDREHPYHDEDLELKPGRRPAPPPAAHFGRRGGPRSRRTAGGQRRTGSWKKPTNGQRTRTGSENPRPEKNRAQQATGTTRKAGRTENRGRKPKTNGHQGPQTRGPARPANRRGRRQSAFKAGR